MTRKQATAAMRRAALDDQAKEARLMRAMKRAEACGAKRYAAALAADRRCLRCGHAPCSSCKHWCDQMIDGTTLLCCDGDCIYSGEPGADDVTLTDWPTSEPRETT